MKGGAVSHALLTGFDRAQIFLLAARLSDYPEPQYLAQIREILNEAGVKSLCQEISPEHWGGVLNFLGANAPADLRSDYIDLFDRQGNENPLYETQYGRLRALSKGPTLADVAGFYRAFGLNVAGKNEMYDHVAVELEFYAQLLIQETYLSLEDKREGVDIVTDAQQKFLHAHLGRFAGAISRRPGVSSHPAYAAIFGFIRDLVAAECVRLGVVPEPLAWYADESGDAAACCAAASQAADQGMPATSA